jgi:Ca2+-binding EF-hand superfamily protein
MAKRGRSVKPLSGKQKRRLAKRQTMFAGLNAQIRQAMAIASANKSDGLRQIFSKFDVDGNAMVDKREFLLGCTQLGVKITSEEVCAGWTGNLHKVFALISAPASTIHQVDLMWPYFDMDNSGQMDMEEFLLFAEGKTSVEGDVSNSTLPAIGKRGKHTLAALAKSQRRCSIADNPSERRLSPATDENVQAILGKPLWSLTQMRKKVSLLPLPPSVVMKDQEWTLDIKREIPVSDQIVQDKTSPQRNWRGTFFQQVKSDSQLRPMSPLSPPHSSRCKHESPPHAAGMWDSYRQERQKLFDVQREKEKAKERAIQEKIDTLEQASADCKAFDLGLD